MLSRFRVGASGNSSELATPLASPAAFGGGGVLRRQAATHSGALLSFG